MLRASHDSRVQAHRIDPAIFVLALILAIMIVLLVVPASVSAKQGRCCQPLTDGDGPVASDVLFVLRASIGSSTCVPDCVCDADGSGAIAASDALVCLWSVVGVERDLECPCVTTTTTTTLSPNTRTCTSILIRSLAGSDIDTGWTGYAHNQPLIEGAEVTFAIVGRCDHSPDTACTRSEDCPSGPCAPSCDCDDPNDAVCNVAGPTGSGRCTRDLTECATNADCPGGGCMRMFGPPLPLIAANVPACVTTFFEGDLQGTVDVATGDSDAAALLRSRVHLGITSDKPCPRCGALDQNPKIGQQFACNGGSRNGAVCTVEAVSPLFGGVSTACPPDVTSNVSGSGLVIRMARVTTGTSSIDARIPCIVSGICMDDGTSCTTNADCTRCTDDLTACMTNVDCAQSARCAAAPEHPVSCGLYCHCGFCGNDPGRPCVHDGECDQGVTCEAGDLSTGIQEQPNACAGLLCATANSERCCADGDANCTQPTPLQGSCEDKPFVVCGAVPSDPLYGECDRQNAGDCILERQPCFENIIARTGRPSPIGSYCVDDANSGSCDHNADCAVGECVGDSAEPTVVGLFCIPKTGSPAINATAGIFGPGALTLKTAVVYCRCGDGDVGCDEECDDGNAAAGDGCDPACRDE